MSATKLFLAAAMIADAADAKAAVLGPSANSASVFTFQGVALWITILTFGALIYMNQRKVRRENEDDARKRDERIISQQAAQTKEVLDEVRTNRKTTDDRLKELEVKSADFMPRGEIEQRIEHLKVNRVQIEMRHEDKLKEISDCIVDQGKQIAKMEERHHGMADTMTEIKQALKDMGADMKAGFKEITDQQRRTA